MKKFMEEFKAFIARGNVMDMAVGIIIGGAFTSIVTSLVEDIINPLLGLFGGMNFDRLHVKLLGEVNPLNAKKKSAEIEALLEQYIPGVERMQTQMRKYNTAYKALRAENAELKRQVDSSKESVRHRLEVSQQLRELEDLRRMVDNIPPEILQAYRSVPEFQKIER